VLAVALAACGDKQQPVTPTVVATPTPTPAPTAEPTPSIKTCLVEENGDCARSGCCRRGGTIANESELEQSMAELKERHPDWFNADGTLDVDEGEYTTELAKILTETHGICAKAGGERFGSISRDEVGMKTDNSRSQNVDVLLATRSGNVPTIVGVWVCTPASF
jgi:hypothetical protein